MSANNNLYGWLFTYNPYHDLWYACNRDHYLDLFSNRASNGVISSADFESLKQIIIGLSGSHNTAEPKTSYMNPYIHIPVKYN